ncbi:HK97 gp10 family phage protein [Alkalicoccobacillus plakortidis]|uniref:HK97 gp10 family phage protein n=1 Tax=Alkalicoccobacillus plakortidis TaxID=444060 RepID=A0ABT0XDW3_9BACI|nr:HK97 gp10 family phage protein [Alkalicoccobacillus plakortidis]MCM2674091.1 HK97 gp10 family phage protein [Alkalicoccobacillus plakortidis]
MRFEGLDQLRKQLSDATKTGSGSLRNEMALWLEGIGMDFIDVVQDEIIRTRTVDTSRLLNSFGKGDGDNVWNLTKGSLTLEIGSNVEYASFVNDGHFTVDLKSGKDRRWVPGRWKGSRFEYDPTSKEGMLLKVKWVDGSNYWDNAKFIYERMFEKDLEIKLNQWMNTKFT